MGKTEKKEEKKSEKKKEAAPAEDLGNGLALPVKKKDPLDELPAGSFNMEEWKRFYSNNDEDDSIKWFWEHFGAEHYSIWRSDYKFNNELTMVAQYWKWEGNDLEGRKFNQGKILK